MASKTDYPRTEPAYSLLYEPQSLAPVSDPPNTERLRAVVDGVLGDPLNEKQGEAFSQTFTERLSLLWGPPGTGKTKVLAAAVLGWIERACIEKRPLTIGVGSKTWAAIDKLLGEVADLVDRRREIVGEFSLPVSLVRLRGEHSERPSDPRLLDIVRRSDEAAELSAAMYEPSVVRVVGGTWMQLSKAAAGASADGKTPVAHWFDLVVIDEASQVEVSAAAAYFLLAKEDANVTLAGDHKQLGPIYGFAVADTAQGLFDCIFSYAQEALGVVPVPLKKNYRTNLEVSEWPRVRFYSEGYEALFPARRLDLTLPGMDYVPPAWPAGIPWSPLLLKILDPRVPVVVVTYNLPTFTVSNPFEAQVVAGLVLLYRRLLEQHVGAVGEVDFWNKRLGIVTPHRAQMSAIRNLLVQEAGLPMDPAPIVDTVDRFQGQERDLMLSSYSVADPDFTRSEDEFILSARRFNTTLTRTKCKFVMFVSDALTHYLPSDPDLAREAAHLQLFVEDYCTSVVEDLELPFVSAGATISVPVRFRGRVAQSSGHGA